MATRNSTGSEAGAERARPSAPDTGSQTGAAGSTAAGGTPPTIEQIAAVAAAAAAAAIAQLQALPAARHDAVVVASPPATLTGEASVSGEEAPSGSVGDEDDDEDEDEDEKLGVDDERSNFDPEWNTEIETLVDAERGRIYLVDATLGEPRDREPHLEAQRLDNGDQQLVVCLARRLLQKTINRLDSYYLGAAVEKAVATAFAARDEGLSKFDPYSDTLETGRAHSRWADREAAKAAGSPPSESVVEERPI
jgi:hypothetical protein